MPHPSPQALHTAQLDAGQVLLVDKPLQWTSFDVVAKIRAAARIRKVGHAGTLDPLASGLLILCTGKATKQIDTIQGAEKEYLADIQFGAVTPSYDAEFPPEDLKDTSALTADAVRGAMQPFTGEIEQRPPAFSALKVDGKRAYDLARKGQEVALQPRRIHVYAFELLSFDAASARAVTRIVCQKGTYVRSLAHDLGQALGTGAYLAGLQRTRIGSYRLADAWQLPDLVAALQAGRQPAGSR